MPRSQEAYALTGLYRRELLALRTTAMAGTAAAWRGIDRENLDATFDAWLAAAAAMTAAASRQAIAATTTHLERYLSAELAGSGMSVEAADVDRAEEGRDGRPLTETLLPALFTVKSALALGRPAPLALGAGLARATRTVAVEVMGSAREAMDEISHSDERIVGWRRATTGSACGACLAAATGAIQGTETVLRAHAHCRCVKEVVVAGTSERFRRPTGQQLFDRLPPAGQDALFAGRGGKAKADLLRSGDIELTDLLSPQHLATVPDEIVETPLAALRG